MSKASDNVCVLNIRQGESAIPEFNDGVLDAIHQLAEKCNLDLVSIVQEVMLPADKNYKGLHRVVLDVIVERRLQS